MPTPEEETQLREALIGIEHDVRWYFSCWGAISRDDLVAIMRDVQARIDGVRHILWPQSREDVEPPPLGNDF